MPKREKERKANVRQFVEKYQANCERISEIADACEKEQRERNKAEETEYGALARENQLLQMKMQAAAAEQLRENPNTRTEIESIIRENASHGAKTEMTFVRDLMMVDDVKSGGVIPLNVQDIMAPLEEGFILDKVGLPMPTGLAGDYVWPTYEMVEATVLGEGTSLGDTKISFNKLSASPARIGIAIPVSYQSLNQTAGLLDTIVRQIMPQSIKALLNKILFSTTAVNSVASSSGLVGPFIEALKTKVALSNVPTFDELNRKMKAAVLSTGIDGEHLCFIMSKSMEALLEGVPINKEGIYVPMLQNHTLCGIPVYTTNAIRDVKTSYKKYSNSAWGDYTLAASDTVNFKVTGDSVTNALATISSPTANDIAEVTVVTEYIGLGDWRYQPMGLFGSMRFVVDPYTPARKDAVDFVLNVDYGTKTLRTEAFIIGEVAAKSN